MSELIIHIGMGKAASTTIQKRILTQSTSPISIGRHHFSEYKELGIDPTWWRGLTSPNSSEANKAIDYLKENYLDLYPRVVLTDEVISSSPDFLDNLTNNLDGIDCDVKILFVIREQSAFLESMYNHSMRAKVNAIHCSHYNVLANRLSYSGNIDEWIEDLLLASKKGDGNIIDCLSYDSVAEKLFSYFGEDNVFILPLELLKTDPVEFFFCISGLFHMDKELVASMFDQKENSRGNRLRDYKLGLATDRMISNPIFSPIKKLGITRAHVSHSLINVLRFFRLRNIQELDGAFKKKIENRFAINNKNLNKMISHDLDGMGYMVK